MWRRSSVEVVIFIALVVIAVALLPEQRTPRRGPRCGRSGSLSGSASGRTLMLLSHEPPECKAGGGDDGGDGG
jgi:hypothetical protein